MVRRLLSITLVLILLLSLCGYWAKAADIPIRHSPNISRKVVEEISAAAIVLDWLNATGHREEYRMLVNYLAAGNEESVGDVCSSLLENILNGYEDPYLVSGALLKALKILSNQKELITNKEVAKLIEEGIKKADSENYYQIASFLRELISQGKIDYSSSKLKVLIHFLKLRNPAYFTPLVKELQTVLDLSNLTQEILMNVSIRASRDYSIVIGSLLASFSISEENISKEGSLENEDYLKALIVLEELGPNTRKILRRFISNPSLLETAYRNRELIKTIDLDRLIKYLKENKELAPEINDEELKILALLLSKGKGSSIGFIARIGEERSVEYGSVVVKLPETVKEVIARVNEERISNYARPETYIYLANKSSGQILANEPSGIPPIGAWILLIVLGASIFSAAFMVIRTGSQRPQNLLTSETKENVPSMGKGIIGIFWSTIYDLAAKLGIEIQSSWTHREIVGKILAEGSNLGENLKKGLKGLMMAYERNRFGKMEVSRKEFTKLMKLLGDTT